MGADSRRLLSRSADATEALGLALGGVLVAGTVLTLDGDLGSGKTCFVRGLARGLGIEEPVGSPTYTLMQAYEGGRLPLYHFDAWMEQRERALLADGGDEWLRADGVSVVEWAERVEPWLPSPRISITLAHVGWTERSIELAAVGETAAATRRGEGSLAFLVAALALPEGIEELSRASEGALEHGGGKIPPPG